MELPNNCYRFEKNVYTDGIFEGCVDATYVIHLEGNGRHESIQEQFKEYHPTNTVYIVFNKGYKNCKKGDHIKLPTQDLTNAFLEIFKNAKIKNYNNILILEDDFIFNKKIKDPDHQKKLCKFLKDNENADIQYLLGCMPLIKMPYFYDLDHCISIVSLGTHAAIYTKSNREKILNKKEEEIKDWDIYNFLNSTRYTYHIPLCYQLLPETENSKLWGSENLFLLVAAKIAKMVFSFFKLDTQTEPGYSFFYKFSNIFFFILLFTLFVIIYWVYTYFVKMTKTIRRKNK
jgi:hypothetical protein